MEQGNSRKRRTAREGFGPYGNMITRMRGEGSGGQAGGGKLGPKMRIQKAKKKKGERLMDEIAG